MPGLFIQRQAEALAKQHTIQVISVHPDPQLQGKYELVHSVENSVNVCRVYYRSEKRLPVISSLVLFCRYVKAHHLGYTSLEPFSVDVVHGHILTREIFFTWYMARKQKRPYIISEHWSRYFPGNGSYKGLIRKWLSRFLLKRSSGLIAVSEPLLQAMKAAKLVHPKSYIVPNGIDVTAFVPPVSKPRNGKAASSRRTPKRTRRTGNRLGEPTLHRKRPALGKRGYGPAIARLQRRSGWTGDCRRSAACGVCAASKSAARLSG